MEKLSFRERLAYGLGTGGEQFPFFMANAYLFYFFNVVLGINALAIGTIFMIARVWDAVVDPIMGVVADHSRSRWGCYRPWVFFATIPMGIFLVLSFSDLGLSGNIKPVIYAILYICFMMSNTASVIPLGSMINVMTTDYQERGVLGTFREFGSALGNLGTSILIPAVLSACLGSGMSEASGYRMTAVILSVLCILVLAITFFNTRERIAPPKENVSFFQSFKVLKGNAPAFSLVFAFFFMALFSGLRQSFNAYYVSYYLGGSTNLLMVMSLAPLFLLYFIPGLTRRLGKRNMMLIGCACIVLSGILFLAARTNTALNIVASFIAGWGQVLTFSGMWSSLPDASDYGEYKNQVRAPALVFAVANFSLKLSMSVNAVIIGAVLTAIAFDESAAVQAASTQNGIYLFNGISLVVCGILAALCLLTYQLNAAKAAEISETLAKSRSTAQ